MDALISLKGKTLFILSMAGWLSFASADSLVTPENGAVGGIARAIAIYQTLNNGQTPTSWEQLSRVYSLDKVNENLIGRQSYPIQDRYQFITQPMSFRGHGEVTSEGSQVILIRTVPLEKVVGKDISQKRQWRYLVVRSKSGEISSVSLPEADVQAMLRASGVIITPKPSLPAVETDELVVESQTSNTISSSTAEAIQPNRKPEQFFEQKNALASKSSPSSFPVIPVAIVGVVIASAIVFLLRRKSQ